MELKHESAIAADDTDPLGLELALSESAFDAATSDFNRQVVAWVDGTAG